MRRAHKDASMALWLITLLRFTLVEVWEAIADLF